MINYTYLYTHGFDDNDWMILNKISQKNQILLNLGDWQRLREMEEIDLISFIKQERTIMNARLTPKGRKLMVAVSEAGLTPEIGNLLDSLREIWREKNYLGKFGSYKEAQKHLVWFCSNTPFAHSAILEAVDEYLDKMGEEKYIPSLANLIWKPNGFYDKYDLSKSRLESFLCNKYEMDGAFVSDPDKAMAYLMAIANLPKPPHNKGSEYYMSGSKKGDMDMIKKVKVQIGKLLKK